jgi:hypothetical protein
MPPSTPSPERPDNNPARELADYPDDSIDLRDIVARLGRGTAQIIGLGLLGLAVAVIGAFLLHRLQEVPTTARIVFSFPGFERGQYPDKSDFQPDDLRAPAVIADALRRQKLDASSEFQARVRSGLSIEGIIPPNIAKERDRLRAAGQTPPAYIPNEYALTLLLPRNATLSNIQRERLLGEIVAVYRENFRRTYGEAPVAFGTAFETLRSADYPEYEIVFNSEISNIKAYLNTQLDDAKSFRSPTTNLSFKDLLDQTDLFAQIHLNETLGMIHDNGLSRNRTVALMKMDYHLRQLDEDENHAIADEKVITDLLTKTQARDQNYVLGIKSQAQSPRAETTVLDQGLIDSLLANDANNFLVHQALDAGLKVKAIQAEKAQLTNLRDNMKSFMKTSVTNQSTMMAQVQESLKNLETSYRKLIDNIRKTQADYANQQFGGAIRISDQIRTAGLLKPLAVAGIVGAFLGLALGAGLSLLGFYVGKTNPA